MLILIDKEQLRMVAAAGSRKWINLVAYVDFPDIEGVIVDGQEGRTWSTLTREQLSQLFTNMSGQPAPEYDEAIKALAAYAETWPPYAKSMDVLEVEAERIFQEEQASKTDQERALEAQAMQRLAHQQTIAIVEAEKAAISPEQKAQATAERPKPAEKAPTDPAARPQQGATKKIWDIADDLLAVHGAIGNIKLFRKEVIERAKALGLNEGTAATQFGKWKASKGL